LPIKSKLYQQLQQRLKEGLHVGQNFKKFLDQNLQAGDIDVNIMTKLDKENFDKNVVAY
jgi:hypothetical protein